MDKVKEFLDLAFGNLRVVCERNGKKLIRCPCVICDNRKFLEREEVSKHLLKKDFRAMYHIWHKHGEPYSNDNADPSITTEENIGENQMESMVMDVAGPYLNWDSSSCEEPPNAKAKAFYDMLESADEPLWEISFSGETKIKCETQTVLSAITQCLNLKSDFCMSEENFNRMMSIMKSMLPLGEKLPKDLYQAKKLVRGLGMDYKKIDVCPNNCMLYYKVEDCLKDKCDTCGEPRYKNETQNSNGKPIPRKVLRYLPITPRLQRLYMVADTVEHMRWHKEGKRANSKLLVHLADSMAWKEFDKKHEEFATEARNVRLGLSTDGFAPFNFNGSPYMCWPVFVFPYNLPPGLVMRKEYIFLALVIPGPKSPGRDIDIFLQPLVDELNELWSNGVETFGCSRKQIFFMKASLMWTVNDYPAYEMLSGWGTHGKMACSYCMEFSKAFRLENGRKPCWFDSHRMFLPENDPFRFDKDNFIKDRQEHASRPPILPGEKVRDIMDKLSPYKLGKNFSH